MSGLRKDTSEAQHQPTDSDSLTPPGLIFLTEAEAKKKGEYSRGVDGWEAFRREWINITRELQKRIGGKK